MRIQSGSARGRQLPSPEGKDIRPTTDRVRLAVFNAVGALVPGCRFLDLYCGSGSVGLEALSRGASQVHFVDQSRVCAETVRASAAALGFDAGAWTVWPSEAILCLGRLASRGERFDLVYVDPPYASGLGPRTLDALASLGVLAEGPASRILYEHASADRPVAPAGWRIYRRYDHGAASVTVFGPADGAN